MSYLISECHIIGPGYESKVLAWIFDRFEQINAMPEHRKTVVDNAVAYLKKGESVFTAPEGDLQDPFQLGAFFPGAARIYRKSRAPIIPIVLVAPRCVIKEWPFQTVVDGRAYRTVSVLRGLFCINVGEPFTPEVTDDGGVDMKCPTEIAISDRREAELAKNGFMPLIHKKNSDFAAFIGAESLQKPAEYDDPDATANANLSSRLPYLFASCRFAHYLKCIVRDKIGSFKEREDMEKWLHKWINNYVEPNPSTASEEDKARKPLAAAEVVVEEVEGNPGYYSAKISLRPHYQLEGLTVSLRLVSKLPSQKAG